jgi:transcriptional regulator with XRE-family HTH domain
VANANKKRTSLARHLGSAAREARLRTGLTQQEVAEYAELATEVYGRLERGHMLPSLPTLMRLCLVLRVDANTLLGFSTAEPPSWLAQPPPAPSEPPAVRRLLRAARQLTPKQLTILGSAAQAMVHPPQERASRGPRQSENATRPGVEAPGEPKTETTHGARAPVPSGTE